jgi:putative two-component system response regulator
MGKGRSLVRRWPYMVVATGLVTAMPAYVATLVAPPGSAPGVLGALLVALVLSIAAAKLGAALWMRHPLAREMLFADLMVWEWLRRLSVEHRLARAQRLLDANDGAPRARAEGLARLARVLEARDAYTHGHSRRVARHALRIAQALHVPAADAARIWTAATLHDIGKISTPREVLNKRGPLTDAEFEVVKRHPVDGAVMLAGIGDPDIVAIVRSHHERLDGAGYPDGLTGAEIPLGARLIAVADTFDALTSTRSYRSAATHKRALDILRQEAGAQLDGPAVAAFLRTYSGRRPAAWSALATLVPQRLISWLGNHVTSVASAAPAAGWVAPAAAAAAVLAGTAPHVADRATTRTPHRAVSVADVRAAGPSHVRRVVASQPPAIPRDPGTVPAVKSRPHASDRKDRSPAAGHADTAPPAQATATRAPAVGSTGVPPVDAPAVSPGATAVTDVVGAVKDRLPRKVRIPAGNPGIHPVKKQKPPHDPARARTGKGH